VTATGPVAPAMRVAGLVRGMVRDGFEAAPGWMWATTGLTLLSGIAYALYPYGFKALTDALLDRDATAVTVAVAATGGLIALQWMTANLDANVGFGLVDRVGLLVAARLATLVNRVGGIDHFERPDRLRQLDLVEENRDVLASAPRNVLTVASTTLRAALVTLLLGSVHPVLLLLPLVAVAPLVAEGRATRTRDRADEAVNDDKRLADELFNLATTAAPAKELRIYGLSDEMLRRHDAAAARVARATTRAALRGGAIAAAGWAVFLAGFVAGIVVVGGAAVDGDVSPGQVVLAVVLAQQVRLVLGTLTYAFGQLGVSIRTVERLRDLEETLAGEEGRTGAPPAALAHGIDLEGVSFRYPGATSDSLRDLTLHLPAGATVAVVGDNGAGKTSLVKLLTGMYSPTGGRITVDGTDLATFDLTRWRERVSGGFQDHVPFELVAREAVGVGDLPRVAEEAVVAAALDRAGGSDVVATLPDGLETALGRSFVAGRELSGGQWQKLALGRAMMRDEPLLLVLDEPTASLDAETEHRLFERYRSAAGRTASASGGITVLVSHRFSTVRGADLIVVVEAGRVTEVGTHPDLVRAGGTYAELYALQARGYR